MRLGLGLGFANRAGVGGGGGGGGMAIGFSASKDEGTVGDIFVAKTGLDTNPGTFGSPKLTIAGAMAIATSGQEIKVRAGTYRETVDFTGKSGTSGNRTTISRYGNEQVIISAAEPLTGFVACTVADLADVGANWTQMFKVTVPLTNFVGSDPRAAFPYENGVRLNPAISWKPNPQYPGQQDVVDQWWTADSTVTSGGLITGYIDASVTGIYSTAQIQNADVLFHYSPNRNSRTPVLSVVSGTINITDTTRTYESNAYKDNYALINLLPAMQRGQWGYKISGSDAIIYVWPNTPANINTSIEISRRGRCVDASSTTLNHIELRGLILERASSGGADTDGNYAFSGGGTADRDGYVIENCLIRQNYRSDNGYGGIWIGNVDNWRIERCTITEGYGQFGAFCQGRDWDGGGMAVGGRFLYNVVSKVDKSPIRFYGQENCLAAFSRFYECGNAAHANKGNYYASCHRVVFWGCDFRGASGYLTFQEASSVVIGFCDVPVSYNGNDGRAIVDQNSSTVGQQSPATEQSIPGPSFILNNMTEPFVDAIAGTNSLFINQTLETQVTYTGKNNILHGASTVDQSLLTANGWRNNVLTSGSALAASAGTDTTALPADVYVDQAKGNVTVKSTSPTRSAGTASIATEVATLQSWFPDQTSVFTKDLIGATFTPATPPMGPYVNPDNAPQLAPIWIERPTLSGSLTDGSLLSVDDGYLVGFPWPSRTFQWVRSTDGFTWTDIAGQTSATYTTSGDVGFYVGRRTTAGGVSTISSGVAPVVSSYAIANPLALVAPTAASFGTLATRQVETASFTANNKPIMVLFTFVGSASDATATVTIGTPLRSFGTGTAITNLAGRARRTSYQTLAYTIIAPGSGTVSVQCETVAMTIRCYRVEVIELGGATSFVGGTAAGGTGITSRTSTITTGAANTLVMHLMCRSSGDAANVISATGATLFTEGNTGGTSTADDARTCVSYEQAPASATVVDENFTWPTSANGAAISIEVRS